MNNLMLKHDSQLYDAVRIIEEFRKSIAVVTDESGHLLGTITDGDIRRALLAGHSLNTPVNDAMNQHPVTAEVSSSDSYILDLLKRYNLEALPLIDTERRFKRIVHINDLSPDEKVSGGAEGFYAAVIIAGGEGRRLRPFTEDIPKPMIDIGGMPLIERQLRKIGMSGINRVYISVNYLSHVIEEHFGDGTEFGVKIEYLHEEKKLGTAGALSLVTKPITGPLIVMNGDVLTTSDYRHLLYFHTSHAAKITVGAVNYRVEIPYGVIRADGVIALGLEEKPSERFLCNAGIYAVSPEALDIVPQNQLYNMTDLIQDCIAEGEKVSVFPIHEYWTDIGTPADLAKAREDIKNMGDARV